MDTRQLESNSSDDESKYETPEAKHLKRMAFQRGIARRSILEVFSKELVDTEACEKAGYQVEAGIKKPPQAQNQSPQREVKTDMLDTDQDKNWYRELLYKKEHVNFITEPDNEEPVIISFEPKSTNERAGVAIIRTKKRTKSLFIPSKYCASYKKMISYCRTKFEELSVNSGGGNLVAVPLVRTHSSPELEEDLVRYEDQMIQSKYKFGILYVKQGQNQEDDYFSNGITSIYPDDLFAVESSKLLEDFLTGLGTKITLQDWKGFRGGLDVKSDKQQVERKRHIGNDVVVIVFKESDTPFNPVQITSHFNHVFIVIQPDKLPTGKVQYKTTVVCKPGVNKAPPHLPFPPVFADIKDLRDFLLPKLINSERSAMHSPEFEGKLARTRKELLNEILTNYRQKGRRRTNSIFRMLSSSAEGMSPPRPSSPSSGVATSPSALPSKLPAELPVVIKEKIKEPVSLPYQHTEHYENGDSYTGELNEQGQRHGQGKYHFANGDIYEGQFVQNKMSGKGKLVRVNGDRYEGDFLDNKYHGNGVCYYTNGDIYEGQYEFGERHGNGIYRHIGGNYYEGQFFKGKIHGLGKYTYASGDTYEGQFEDGMYHGEGLLTYANGDYYKGQFANNLKHGKGVYTHATGAIYIGEYYMGERCGQGVFVDENGDRYEGHFENGKPNGQGKHIFANGSLYEGQFKDDTFEGLGKYISSTVHYEGEFKNSKRNGKGRMIKSNGDVYEGQFVDDIMHGEGFYTWKATGNVYKGMFANGKPNGHGALTQGGQTYRGIFKDGKVIELVQPNK